MEKKYCFWMTVTTGFAVLLMLISADCIAQECVGCYDSQGHYKAKGSSWTEVYNGVTYDCVCDCRSGNGVTSTPRGSQGSVNTSFETDFKLMLVQAFIDFIFSDNSTTISDEERIQKERQIKEQQEELERINAENEKQRKLKDKLAQELHNKLMALYKMLPDSDSKLEQKLLTDYIDKKSFDGDSTGIEYKDINDIPSVDLSPKTGEDVHRNFFGTDVSVSDLNLITDPDNDPMIVKVTKTKEYLKEKVNEDKLTVDNLKGDEVKKDGEPIIVKEKCSDVNKLLAKYVKQRENFQQTVNLASDELDVWKEGTKEAMIEMAKNVASFAFDRIVDVVKIRNEKALNFKNRFMKNEEALRKKGVKYDEYMKKLDRQILAYDAADLISELQGFKDKFEGTRNITHSLAKKLDSYDGEMKEIWKDPLLNEFLSDDPEQDAKEFTAETIFEELLDKDNIKGMMDKKGLKKMIGKNGFKHLEMFVDNSFLTNTPVVAYSQFAVTTVYDISNILTNYYRVLKANEINNNVMETANIIQHNINETYSRLKDCK